MSILLFATLIWQVVDFLRELTDIRANKSSVLTQATAWLGGIALVAVAAHAAVTAGLTFPGLDRPLGSLDFGSVVLVGLMASSLASSLVDGKQAIDNRDTSVKPPLFGGKTSAVVSTDAGPATPAEHAVAKELARANSADWAGSVGNTTVGTPSGVGGAGGGMTPPPVGGAGMTPPPADEPPSAPVG